MRILVTLGGTSESIDQVREITNQSTGQLGTFIAEQFLAQGAVVDAVVTKYAKHTKMHPNLSLHLIHDTQDLTHTLNHLLQLHPYDAVIHSMAVSDFTPKVTLSEAQLLAAMNAWLIEHPNEPFCADWFHTLHVQTENKISSATDHLTVILEKTPKVIQMIKQLQPDTLLVGFKLLVGVSKEELLTVAASALVKNQADFVLANDLSDINQKQHIGYLLNQDGIVAKATQKPAIAQMICNTLVPILNERRSQA